MCLFQILFARAYHNNIRKNNVEAICESMVDIMREQNSYSLQNVAKANGFNMYVFNSKFYQCLQGYDSNGQEDRKVEVLGWLTEDSRLDVKKVKELFSILEENGGTKYCVMVESFMDMEGESIIYIHTYKQFTGYELVLFVYAPVYSMDSIMSTLTMQLLVVTCSSLLLSLLVGSMLSWQFSKPIEKMSENARILANGTYSIRFEGNGLTEIDDLSDSLNYATKALANSETVRKDIMANVSHDLRTPLTLIKSYAEMVRDLSGDDKVKREKHLNTIIKETERLTDMVNDILKLSKSEKTGELKLEEYDLSQQVNDILDMMVVADEKGFTLERSVVPTVTILADKQKLSQVIINFLSNAYKYSGDSRSIRATLRIVGNRVRFDVFDNGIGISEEELPYVWDRYTKASLKHKVGDSNGIGLSIAKSILVQHRAKYGVNSVLGKGSNFYFEMNLPK